MYSQTYTPDNSERQYENRSSFTPKEQRMPDFQKFVHRYESKLFKFPWVLG